MVDRDDLPEYAQPENYRHEFADKLTEALDRARTDDDGILFTGAVEYSERGFAHLRALLELFTANQMSELAYDARFNAGETVFGNIPKRAQLIDAEVHVPAFDDLSEEARDERRIEGIRVLGTHFTGAEIDVDLDLLV